MENHHYDFAMWFCLGFACIDTNIIEFSLLGSFVKGRCTLWRVNDRAVFEPNLHDWYFYGCDWKREILQSWCYVEGRTIEASWIFGFCIRFRTHLRVRLGTMCSW